MRYLDLHCDTLTVCFDGGYSLSDCGLHTSFEKLNKSGCAAQCFAIFTQGESEARFKDYLGFYSDSLKRHGVKAVLNYSDLEGCLNGERAGAILTVENLGFMSCAEEVNALASAGVKMASLVWNYENRFARPNLVFDGGLPLFDRREVRGLKPLGREVISLLDEYKIIADVSHLSDGGAEEILTGRKIPIVASHSDAFEVCGVSRNLTDGLIGKISDCGGVIGLNFCKDFLGDGDVYGCILRHLKHMLKVGGEDVVAFGSDFDGIPTVEGLEDCTKMPRLIDYLSDNGVSARVLEKLCYKNFARVFREVIG